MRYTIVKNGIQERVNYLVGTNDTDPSVSGYSGLTRWSAQNSMITNLRRIVKGIVGNSPNGRVMKGLHITQDGTSSRIVLEKGTGFTVAGNIIVVNVNVTKDLGAVTKGTEIPIYLLYAEAVNTLEPHMSEIMGTTVTPINIINDEKCAGTNTEATIIQQIAIITTDLSTTDGLYIGKVIVEEDAPTLVFSILHTRYDNNDALGASGIEYTYTGSFGISGTSGYSGVNNVIYSYNGITNNTSVPIIGTGNKVHYLQIKRNVASDTGTRVYTIDDTADNMKTHIQIWGWQKDGAGPTLLYEDIILPDTTNANHVDDFVIDDLSIPDSVYGLTIKTSTVGPSSGYFWNAAWTPTGYGPATVTMVIQKLTSA